MKGSAFILVSLITTNNSKAQNASFNYSTSTGTVGTTYSWIDCSTGGIEFYLVTMMIVMRL